MTLIVTLLSSHRSLSGMRLVTHLNWQTGRWLLISPNLLTNFCGVWVVINSHRSSSQILRGHATKYYISDWEILGNFYPKTLFPPKTTFRAPRAHQIEADPISVRISADDQIVMKNLICKDAWNWISTLFKQNHLCLLNSLRSEEFFGGRTLRTSELRSVARFEVVFVMTLGWFWNGFWGCVEIFSEQISEPWVRDVFCNGFRDPSLWSEFRLK